MGGSCGVGGVATVVNPQRSSSIPGVCLQANLVKEPRTWGCAISAPVRHDGASECRRQLRPEGVRVVRCVTEGRDGIKERGAGHGAPSAALKPIDCLVFCRSAVPVPAEQDVGGGPCRGCPNGSPSEGRLACHPHLRTDLALRALERTGRAGPSTAWSITPRWRRYRLMGYSEYLAQNGVVASAVPTVTPITCSGGRSSGRPHWP